MIIVNNFVVKVFFVSDLCSYSVYFVFLNI